MVTAIVTVEVEMVAVVEMPCQRVSLMLAGTEETGTRDALMMMRITQVGVGEV